MTSRGARTPRERRALLAYAKERRRGFRGYMDAVELMPSIADTVDTFGIENYWNNRSEIAESLALEELEEKEGT